jgi:diguanylate cyclase (GGDEF)-like protein
MEGEPRNEQPSRHPLEGHLEETLAELQRTKVLNADTQEALAMLAEEARLEAQQAEREKHEVTREAEHLRELSTKDELTEILNRRGFLEEVKRITSSIPTESVDNPRREGFRHLAVALLDIDHFKAFNDSLGHAAGDIILKRVAQHLAQELKLRTNDIVARYGGEEFIIGFPGASEEDVLKKLSELRKAMGEPDENGIRLVVSIAGERLDVTMSCGVTSFQPGENIQETIDRADKALYAAKAAGRDRALPYDPETMSGLKPKGKSPED